MKSVPIRSYSDPHFPTESAAQNNSEYGHFLRSVIFKNNQYIRQNSIYISYDQHCVKSVHIRSFFGLHFPAFWLNTDVSLCIQTEYGCISLYLVPMWENADQKKNENWELWIKSLHFFFNREWKELVQLINVVTVVSWKFICIKLIYFFFTIILQI